MELEKHFEIQVYIDTSSSLQFIANDYIRFNVIEISNYYYYVVKIIISNANEYLDKPQTVNNEYDAFFIGMLSR